MPRVLVLVGALVLLVRCGWTSGPDVTRFNAEVAATRQAVTAYRAVATDAGEPADCLRELGSYRTEVEPRTRHMRELSGGFDGCMMSLGRSSEADVKGMCSSMDTEITRYALEGCRSTDRVRNVANALAHCDRMIDWLDGSSARSATLGASMQEGRCQ